jgi:hypothetical protein
VRLACTDTFGLDPKRAKSERLSLRDVVSSADLWFDPQLGAPVQLEEKVSLTAVRTLADPDGDQRYTVSTAVRLHTRLTLGRTRE